MEKKTENSVSMFKTVKAVCDVNIAVINANVGLNNTYNQFLTRINEIEALARNQTLIRSGITVDKKYAREQLALLVEAAAGIIKAHFDSVNNFDVFNAVNVSASKLRTMRDQLFIIHTQNVVGILSNYQADLAPFGVDAAYITNISTVFAAYENIAPQPTVARNNKSTATKLLKEKVSKMLIFLKNELNNAMLIIKVSHPEIYNTYLNARKTVDNGIRHQDILLGAIKGVVKDETSNQVLPSVLIEIVGTETIVITNNLGEFTIIDIPPATYILKASIGNYDVKLVDNITVTANGNTEVEIKLTPSA